MCRAPVVDRAAQRLRVLGAGLLACCAVLAGAPAAQAVVATPRIVGGSEAAPPDWPSAAFLVAMEDVRDDGVLVPSFMCTGTVIDASWVLTAAHCVLGADGRPVPRMLVKLGITRVDDSSAGYVAASELHVHPAYDAAAHRFDVALIRLSTPTAAPVMSLATADGAAAGRYVTVPGLPNSAGWGATDAASPTMSPVLEQAFLQPQPDDVCRSAHPAYDAATMLCAVTPDTAAACRGDSGGPLTAVDGPTGATVLTGVTSFGAQACSLRVPAYFTRVAAIGPFVATYVGGGGAVAAAGAGAPTAAAGAPTSAAGVVRSSRPRRPVVGTLRLAPRRFRAVGAGTPASAARGVAGSKLTFKLSKPAAVALSVQRQRTVGGRTVWHAVAPDVHLRGTAGMNARRMTGRAGGRALAPGRYRVVLRATDAEGSNAAPARIAFEITR